MKSRVFNFYYLLYTIITVLVISIVSCNSEGITDISITDKNEVMNLGHITMEQARGRLNTLLGTSIIRPRSTQVTATLITSSVAYNKMGEILSRSDEDEAYYYVFHIGDNGSYAIISATDQLPELIAFSEGGNNENENNEPDSKFMSYIRNLPDSLSITDGFDIGGEAIADSIAYKFLNDQTTYEQLNGIEPMDIAWSDGYPFTRPFDYMGLDYTSSYGIPAITATMFLAHPNMRPKLEKPYHYMVDAGDTNLYYEWEAMYEIKTDSDYKWASMTSIRNLGILLRHMWSAFGQPNMFDGPSVGEYYDDLITKLELYFGYFGVQGGVRELFDLDNAITEIGYEGYPIIIVNYGPSEGNMWVSDGVLVQKTPYLVYNTRTMAVLDRGTRFTYLLHCNWGCRGNLNGYYPPDLMSTKTGGVDEYGNPLKTGVKLTPPEDAIFWNTTHMFYGGRPVK